MNKTTIPNPEISNDSFFSSLATEFIQVLLRGERNTASKMIIDAVQTSDDVKAIYLHVFQKTQREIGRLWQTGQISVAQEHFCTAATQMIMSQLYPYIFSNEKIGRRLVATCVGGELHEVGIRMVADFFEIEGWDTYYLGANAPAKSVLSAIDEQEADVLAISSTMYFNMPAVEEMITMLRASNVGRKVKILVGGYPFLLSQDLWKRFGADGFALDAQAAVAHSNTFFEN